MQKFLLHTTSGVTFEYQNEFKPQFSKDVFVKLLNYKSGKIESFLKATYLKYFTQLPTVKIFGTECILQFGRYNNKTIAIEAIEANTGEPFIIATVNYQNVWDGNDYDRVFKFPAVVIKNYSENEGIITELQNAGVLHLGGAGLSGSGGTVRVQLLTDTWQAVAKKQLKIK